MKTKIVYQTDINGIYRGEQEAQQSPLDKELVWLILAGCVETKPPTIDEGKQVFWNGKAWEIQDIPPEPKPEPKPAYKYEPTQEEIDAQKVEDAIQAELRQIAIERIQAKGGTIQ